MVDKLITRSFNFYFNRLFTKKKHFLNCFLTTNTVRHNMTGTMVAVCQMTSTNNVQSNFETVGDLIRRASNAGAKMVFLPEAADYVGTSKQETIELAQTQEEIVEKYSPLAKACQVWVSLGGLHVKVDKEGKVSNSHFLFNSCGELMQRYDKTHMFDVHIPEKNLHLNESSYVEKGCSIFPPVSTPAGQLALAICYDMRFPELSLTQRNLGAEILTFPSAFTFTTGAAHWEVLLKSRAIETQCYVIAAAQCGAHNPKRTSWGHALVVGPWGNIVAQCEEGTGFALANICLKNLKSVRESMPVLGHRRNDLYPSMTTLDVIRKQDTYTFGQVSIRQETVFLQTALSIAFTNKRCVVAGHVLIAPIRKVARFSDLTPFEVADVFQLSQKVAKVMEKKTGATSCTIVVQDGPEAGQTIQHVHVHILPRRLGDFENNDDIYTELQGHDKKGNKFEKPWRTEEEMQEEADEIKLFITSNGSA